MNKFYALVGVIVIAIIGVSLAIISLFLGIINKKKIRARRDKYIFAIIIATISLVFNLFLLVSLILFSIVE